MNKQQTFAALTALSLTAAGCVESQEGNVPGVVSNGTTGGPEGTVGQEPITSCAALNIDEEEMFRTLPATTQKQITDVIGMLSFVPGRDSVRDENIIGFSAPEGLRVDGEASYGKYLNINGERVACYKGVLKALEATPDPDDEFGGSETEADATEFITYECDSAEARMTAQIETSSGDIGVGTFNKGQASAVTFDYNRGDEIFAQYHFGLGGEFDAPKKVDVEVAHIVRKMVTNCVQEGAKAR